MDSANWNRSTPAYAIWVTIWTALVSAAVTGLVVMRAGPQLQFWWVTITTSVAIFIPVFYYFWYPLIVKFVVKSRRSDNPSVP